MTENTIVGFDGAANETSVVVMHRGPDGAWRIESAAGPDGEELARAAAAALTAQGPPAAVRRAWPDTVTEWLTAYTGKPLKLDEQQEEVLRRLYEAGPGGASLLGLHVSAALGSRRRR